MISSGNRRLHLSLFTIPRIQLVKNKVYLFLKVAGTDSMQQCEVVFIQGNTLQYSISLLFERLSIELVGKWVRDLTETGMSSGR